MKRFSDTEDILDIHHHRWFWLKVVVVVAFAVLLLRLFAMQISHGVIARKILDSYFREGKQL